jgi:hypothetical protein
MDYLEGGYLIGVSGFRVWVAYSRAYTRGRLGVGYSLRAWSVGVVNARVCHADAMMRTRLMESG